ncbi:MAG: hypothetical protein AVDCRST_MAG41-3308, partial [uncultured Corynebacteriales bacterium]
DRNTHPSRRVRAGPGDRARAVGGGGGGAPAARRRRPRRGGPGRAPGRPGGGVPRPAARHLAQRHPDRVPGRRRDGLPGHHGLVRRAARVADLRRVHRPGAHPAAAAVRLRGRVRPAAAERDAAGHVRHRPHQRAAVRDAPAGPARHRRAGRAGRLRAGGRRAVRHLERLLAGDPHGVDLHRPRPGVRTRRPAALRRPRHQPLRHPADVARHRRTGAGRRLAL